MRLVRNQKEEAPRSSSPSPIRELAALYGIQTSYVDAMNQNQQASDESLKAVLAIMQAPVDSEREIKAALSRKKQEMAATALQPVTIAWGGQKRGPEVRVPANAVRVNIELENGGSLECTTRRRTSGASELTAHQISWKGELPFGYHTLVTEYGSSRIESALFSAPDGCRDPANRRTWGVFAPVYSLHSPGSWGAGDLRDLDTLLAETQEFGGAFAGILPLLAAFLDQPLEPSPYNPMSRLHWNEFFLHVPDVPGFSDCAEAAEIVSSERFRRSLELLRKSPTVAYRDVMQLKREVLSALSRAFHESGDRARYESFLSRHLDVETYAAFRAAHEMRGGTWHDWPDTMKRGSIAPGDYREEDRRYHMFVQWAMHEQLDSLTSRSGDRGASLYLDYPLGVHPDGYDTWRYQDLFAAGTAVGAPPDAFFTKGQNWGFPPLQPDSMLARKLDYFIASVRNQLRFAGMLRIDHVMALNRLFWIPAGAEPADGVYVQYPAEAMYAVLAIESHRHQSVIIGEDLGTVPDEVRSMMDKRGVRRMYVLQYELSPDKRPSPPPDRSIASINTHDMPTFTAYWNGMDIDQRKDSGLLDRKGARQEEKNREAIRQELTGFLDESGSLQSESGGTEDRVVLSAALEFLAASDTEMVLVNLEDLWQETTPQNVPGTSSENNWKRKLRYSIEETFAEPEVTSCLRTIDERRKSRGK